MKAPRWREVVRPGELRLPGGRRLRRGFTGTAVAAVAMAALTASQAPGLIRPAPQRHEEPAAAGPPAMVSQAPPADDSYHTELPPLISPQAPGAVAPAPGVAVIDPVWTQEGIPATVLAAYQRAESRLRHTEPRCRLPWQLLAALGKVESGHAGGGRVDAHGTTLTPILGPVLDGAGFARIPDTDHGTLDGDAHYDRAVGPMQFIPSTWAAWAQDGNDDGRKDPNNVFDAALAAGGYLCADARDLAVPADLDRAVLSYNHSDDYLRTVLSWLEFYRRGTHAVPDGQGALPSTPGAGSAGQIDADHGHQQGGGIVIGPQPTVRPSRPTPSRPGGTPSGPGPSHSASPSSSPSGSPSSPPSPSSSPGGPSPSPSESASSGPSPTGGPGVPGCPGGSPSASTAPDPGATPSAPGCPSPTP
ncbi:lytic transglycosylase domain-containing protein [Streptomyces sp. NBC_00083]|uniref:lytic transglycosylase domain-containing protein n=1 Tax=Streptomyces sp. NBC_00083 TaxID=2975647 RepID=UPI002259C3BB|nr:lytic transglycosylase domain-containing protein [Streptomyces sp. NBC_00083]MCX5386715.1 lytic transglycosylase domain-containing protein [Streptomyces sp. NBC_00083]